MSDLGQMLRVPAIRFERSLPGGAVQVWAHLTDCAKLSGWYGDDSTIEPREGGQVRLMGGHILGVVTQWIPERKLAHTWNVFAPGETVSPFSGVLPDDRDRARRRRLAPDADAPSGAGALRAAERHGLAHLS